MVTRPETAAARTASPRDEDAVTAEILRRVFARYDPIALGGAIGIVAGAGLFVATAVLLLKGGPRVGETLSLLGNYFLGYQVSWGGALVGLGEGLVLGFLFGLFLAVAINAVVSIHEAAFRLKVDMLRTWE